MRLANPICDIGNAINKTINIAFLNLILKVFSNVLLIEYTSETSVENISKSITIRRSACSSVLNLFATNKSGISSS